MRIAAQIMAVLEGAGFTLVGIDHHQPRPLIATDRPPFLGRGEAGAAAAPQVGLIEDFDDALGAVLPRRAGLQQGVAAVLAIRREDRSRKRHRFVGHLGGGRHQAVDGGPIDQQMATSRLGHGGRRSLVAAADARHQLQADLLRQDLGGGFGQPGGTGHAAAGAAAQAQRGRRWRRFSVRDDVEMGVERCHLEQLGHRQVHHLGQGGEDGHRQMAKAVLQPVQVLDQQVSPQRRLAQYLKHCLCCRRVGDAALGQPRVLTVFLADLAHESSSFFGLWLRLYAYRRSPLPGAPFLSSCGLGQDSETTAIGGSDEGSCWRVRQRVIRREMRAYP